MPLTEEWPTDADWRGVRAQLVHDVGGRMLIAGDGYEPLLILPVVMRGRQLGYVKCKVRKDKDFNYVNAGSKWAGDALYPYDYVRKMLDDAGGPRVAAVVEGCRDALVTIQNGLPALATLGATNWTPKCVSAIKALGLDTLICLADPDDAGDILAGNVYNDLKNHTTVKVVKLPSKIIETENGPKRVKVLDAADLNSRQLQKVLSKLGIEMRCYHEGRDSRVDNRRRANRLD
jgi:5S rRNA maturation endonuclease (ribonuclease M5)